MIKVIAAMIGSASLASLITLWMSTSSCGHEIENRERYLLLLHATASVQTTFEIIKRIDSENVAGALSLAQAYLKSEAMVVRQYKDSVSLGGDHPEQLKVAADKALKNFDVYQERALEKGPE